MDTRMKVVVAVALLLVLGLALLTFLDDPVGSKATAPDEPDAESESAPPDGLTDPGVHPDGEPEPGTPGAEPSEEPGAAPPVIGPARVTGRVLDEHGRPIEGATVTVETGFLLALGAGLTPEPPVTDEFGRFELLAPVGTRAFVVRAPGRVTSRVEYTGGGKPMEISLDPGQPITGVVFEESGGAGVAGVEISAWPEDGVREGGLFFATADAEGRFELGPMPAGLYIVKVGGQFQTGTGAEYLPVTLPPVEAGTADLRIPLVRGHAIAGTIVGPDGEPVSEVVLVVARGLTPQGGDDPTRYRVGQFGNGSFRLAGLREGRYRLSFVPAGGGEAAAQVLEADAGDESLIVRLTPGRPLTGRLEDENGQSVVVKGYLYVSPTGKRPGQGGTVMGHFAGDGSFTTAPLDPGTSYGLFATGFPGYADARLEDVFPGQEGVVLQLKRALRIAGRVVDEEGRPVPLGVGVKAVAPDASAEDPARDSQDYTGRDGSFTIEGLGDFEYELRAGGGQSGYAPGELVTGVRPGGEPVTLVTKRGVSVAGRLTGAGGSAVKARVIGSQPGQAVHPWTTTNKEGEFVLTGLKPGPVELLAMIDAEYVKLGKWEAPAEGLEIPVPE